MRGLLFLLLFLLVSCQSIPAKGLVFNTPPVLITLVSCDKPIGVIGYSKDNELELNADQLSHPIVQDALGMIEDKLTVHGRLKTIDLDVIMGRLCV